MLFGCKVKLVNNDDKMLIKRRRKKCWFSSKTFFVQKKSCGIICGLKSERVFHLKFHDITSTAVSQSYEWKCPIFCESYLWFSQEWRQMKGWLFIYCVRMYSYHLWTSTKTFSSKRTKIQTIQIISKSIQVRSETVFRISFCAKMLNNMSLCK